MITPKTSLVCVSLAGMVYGSLHFTTFDGEEYSFKALGEFVILRLSSTTGSNIFTLQGQTDKLHSDAKVPVLVRMAAFYQGIGKVRKLVWRGKAVELFEFGLGYLYCVQAHFTHQSPVQPDHGTGDELDTSLLCEKRTGHNHHNKWLHYTFLQTRYYLETLFLYF